jgi:DNA repair exonuclease SbcCD ATPase subunit
MIRFENLHIEGGLSFRDSVDFPLAGQGLTKLIGKNLDDIGSNGSGKSSIGDLMSHIIFGTTAKGIKKNQIICNYTDTGYLGILTADIDGKKIKALQSRQHKKEGTKVQLFADTLPMHVKGLEESQALVEKMFRLTLDEWHATTHFSRNEPHLFIKSTGNDNKKAMLARIFSLNYQQYREEAEEKLKLTREELLKLKNNLSASKQQLETTLMEMGNPDPTVKLTEIKGWETVIADTKKIVLDLQKAIDDFDKARNTQIKYNSLKEMIEKSLSNLGEWIGQIPTYAEVEAKITTLADTIKQYNETIVQYETFITCLKDRDFLITELKKFDVPGFNPVSVADQITGLQNYLTDLNKFDISLLRKYNNLRATLVPTSDPVALENKWRELETEFGKVQYESLDLSKQFEGVKSGICITCGHEIAVKDLGELESKLGNIRQKLSEIAVESTKTREAWDKARNEWSYYNQAKAQLDMLAPTYEKVNEEDLNQYKTNTQEQINALTLQEQQFQYWKSLTERSAQYVSLKEYTVEQYEIALSGAKSALDKIKNTHLGYSQLRLTVNQYEMLDPIAIDPNFDPLVVRAKINGHQESLESGFNVLGRLKKEYELLMDTLSKLNSIKGREGEITALENMEQVYSGLTYAFGPKGLIVERLGVICEFLTERVNFYLHQIMKDQVVMKFYMDGDSIDLDIFFKGETRGSGNLSDGERAKVGLACMFGMRSLLPSSHQNNIMILDEADANFDDSIRIELLEILQSIIDNSNIDSIFVVSHADVVKDSMLFKTTFDITKKDGCSTLSVY